MNKLLCPKLNCSCPNLIQVKATKYFGINIHENLKWKAHVTETTNKKKKEKRFILYNLYYFKNKISTNFLINLYYTWIYPILNYGIICWGGDKYKAIR